MLTKILSSESQLTQKASPKLQAVKFFKFAITLVVFFIMLSVCAFAYTESLDGADTVYTFPFVEFSDMPNRLEVPGVTSPKASFTFNGEVINQNNFTTTGLQRYRHINFRPDSIADARSDVTIRASIPVGSSSSQPIGRVYLSLQSDISSPSLSISRSYIIEFYADLPYFNSWATNPLTQSDLTILNGDVVVDVVEPTLIEMVTAYNVVIDGTTYKMQRYKLSYVVESSNGQNISFNSFRYDVNYFAIDLKNPEGSQAYYTQMGIAFFPVTVKVIAPEVVQNYYEAISAGNNDLKQYFGTVNQVDQNRIDSSNSNFSDFNNKVNDLSEAESELDTTIPEGAFDTPNIVTENLGVLDDYWSIFFGSDSDVTPTGLNAFLRDTVVAVTVISMLSLVMFGIGGVISKIRGD